VERNISLINIVGLAHALRVKSARLLESPLTVIGDFENCFITVFSLFWESSQLLQHIRYRYLGTALY